MKGQGDDPKMEGQIGATYHDGSDLRVRLEKRLLKHLQKQEKISTLASSNQANKPKGLNTADEPPCETWTGRRWTLWMSIVG